MGNEIQEAYGIRARTWSQSSSNVKNTKALAIHYNKTKRGRKQEKQINIGHWNIVYNAGTTYNMKKQNQATTFKRFFNIIQSYNWKQQ